jgi:hypothetical protein
MVSAVRESRRVRPRRRRTIVRQHFSDAYLVHTRADGRPKVGKASHAAKAVDASHLVNSVVRRRERRGRTRYKNWRRGRGLGGLSGAKSQRYNDEDTRDYSKPFHTCSSAQDKDVGVL